MYQARRCVPPLVHGNLPATVNRSVTSLTFFENEECGFVEIENNRVDRKQPR